MYVLTKVLRPTWSRTREQPGVSTDTIRNVVYLNPQLDAYVYMHQVGVTMQRFFRRRVLGDSTDPNRC